MTNEEYDLLLKEHNDTQLYYNLIHYVLPLVQDKYRLIARRCINKAVYEHCGIEFKPIGDNDEQ